MSTLYYLLIYSSFRWKFSLCILDAHKACALYRLDKKKPSRRTVYFLLVIKVKLPIFRRMLLRMLILKVKPWFSSPLLLFSCILYAGTAKVLPAWGIYWQDRSLCAILKANQKQSLGKVRILTGGTAREPFGMTWCDSRADSIVWMRKDMFICTVCFFHAFKRLLKREIFLAVFFVVIVSIR